MNFNIFLYMERIFFFEKKKLAYILYIVIENSFYIKMMTSNFDLYKFILNPKISFEKFCDIIWKCTLKKVPFYRSKDVLDP